MLFESAEGAACLQLAERLFESFAPLNKKRFLLFSVPFFGKLRSVDVFRSLYEVLFEIFLNTLRSLNIVERFDLSFRRQFFWASHQCFK